MTPSFRALAVSIFCAVALLSSSGSLASPPLVRLFSERFHSGYRAGRCADNIEGLLHAARSRGIRLSDAWIIRIENQGFSAFGLVNAEHARQAGGRIWESSSPEFHPGEANWYFHVILLADGLVFDFDYFNAPTVHPVARYFETMFLNESMTPEPGRMNVGRKAKLRDYRLTIEPARLSDETTEPQVLTLEKFLAKRVSGTFWRPNASNSTNESS